MTFFCPQCRSADRLVIRRSLALPPDSRSDELFLQVVACAHPACGFRALAVYEESRRGGLDDEHWEHTGYRVSKTVLEQIEALIARCPEPQNARCGCAAHRALGRTSPAGRWLLPEGVDASGMFPISRA